MRIWAWITRKAVLITASVLIVLLLASLVTAKMMLSGNEGEGVFQNFVGSMKAFANGTKPPEAPKQETASAAKTEPPALPPETQAAQATPAMASPAITPSQVPANASAKLEERMGRSEERINRLETRLNEYQPCLDRLCKPKPATHSTKTKVIMGKPGKKNAKQGRVSSGQAVPQGPVMTGSCPGCGQWNPYDQPHQPAPGQVSTRLYDQRIN